MVNQWQGWVKDDYDARDVTYTELLYDKFHQEGQKILDSVDLRAKCPPIYDQSVMGSCTANAIAAALRFARMKALGHDDKNFDPSRQYIYFNSRMLSNAKAYDDEQKRTFDSGSQLRIGIQTFERFGVCPEKQWPYKALPGAVSQTITRQDNKTELQDVWPSNAAPCTPPANLYTHEADWRQYLGTKLVYYRLGYDKLDNPTPDTIKEAAVHKVEQLKRCLSSGYPFIFGFATYTGTDENGNPFDSFAADNFDENGAMKFVPVTKGLARGGHAVLAVGYRKGYFIIRNSWGTVWGSGKVGGKKVDGYKWGIKDPSMKGHFLMSEEWFLTPNRTYDFWLIEAKETTNVHPKFL